MENIQKFRKKGKKLGEYMMTKLRLLRDQKKYRSRGVTLKYMLGGFPGSDHRFQLLHQKRDPGQIQLCPDVKGSSL